MPNNKIFTQEDENYILEYSTPDNWKSARELRDDLGLSCSDALITQFRTDHKIFCREVLSKSQEQKTFEETVLKFSTPDNWMSGEKLRIMLKLPSISRIVDFRIKNHFHRPEPNNPLCKKCGTRLISEGSIYWKCEKCGKTFRKDGIPNMREKRKQSYPICPKCGKIARPNNIYWRCKKCGYSWRKDGTEMNRRRYSEESRPLCKKCGIRTHSNGIYWRCPKCHFGWYKKKEEIINGQKIQYDKDDIYFDEPRDRPIFPSDFKWKR